MKKTLVLLTALLTVSLAYAQQLPDGGFEEWKTGKTYQGDTYDELANPFWQTLNMLSTLPPALGTGPVVVFKEEGHTGFCPRMQSDTLRLGKDLIFLPGVVGAITVIIDEQTAQFGRPYTGRPSALKGVMKYKPVNGDSAAIFVEVYKTSESGQRQIITRNEVIYKDPITDWTEFNIPLNYLSDETPDSICVLFVSSAGYNFDDLFKCQGQVGSTLWVDDCHFEGVSDDGPTANEALNTLKVSAYPNPATDVLNVTVEENAQLTVFDQAGRVLLQQSVQAGENALNIAELKAGFYTFRVTGAQKSGSGKFIKR